MSLKGWDRLRAPPPATLSRWLALAALLVVSAHATPDDRGAGKLVVVLYPQNNDGSPENALVDQSIRSALAAVANERVEVYAEYLDLAQRLDAGGRRAQLDWLRRKYAGRKVDLVIAGLSSGLNFALEHRDTIFPGVPVVHCAVDRRELSVRSLPPDVAGAPTEMDLTGTLDLALRLHPQTRRVFVVAGQARMDVWWAAEARREFQSYEGRLEFTYLTGLPMDELLREVANLPERSIVYYVHVFQDGIGRATVPAKVLELLAQTANAPIYGHVDSYVGRGIVGGRVFRFETAGTAAARVGLRILSGEKPEAIGITAACDNATMFDWQQLQRWGIAESSLPADSVLLHKKSSLWDDYKWPIVGVISLCIVEALLISGLLVQRKYRRRAEINLRESQRELRELTGRLIVAQETERRRIAGELHDDLNQSLALLAVEMDVLTQEPVVSATHLTEQVKVMSDRVRQLSSSVHDLSHQLHPPKLEQLGLVVAVRGLCRELTRGHGLAIDFSHRDVPRPLPQDTALCLYRIVQEALRNTIKHSGAEHAQVRLTGSSNVLALTVSDDGIGFTSEPANRNDGLGLVSMRERVRLVGGTFAVDSRLSAGTRVVVGVPFDTRPESGDSLHQTRDRSDPGAARLTVPEVLQ